MRDKVEIPEEMREKVEEIKRYEPMDESLIVLQALRYGLAEMKKELANKAILGRESYDKRGCETCGEICG